MTPALREPPNTLFWALVAFSIIALSVSKFFGIQWHYFPLTQLALDPSVYPNDFFMQNSTATRVTTFFDVIRVLNLDLTNDAVGYAWHLLWSAICAAILVAMLRQHLDVTDPRWIALVMLILVFADYKLLPQQKSSWLTHHTGTPTQIALVLRFAALYCLLSRRHLATAVLLAVGMTLTVKTMWLLWAVAIVVTFLDRKTPRTVLALYALPLAYPLWKILTGPGAMTQEEARFATEIAMSLYPREDVPLSVETYSLVLFAASFPAYFWVLRTVTDPWVRRVFLVIAVVTAAAFLGGMAYTAGGYRLYANPMFVVLSPVRSAEVYNFAFVLLVALATIRAPRLDVVTKSGVLVALAVLSIVPDKTTWAMLAAAILAVGLLLPKVVTPIGRMAAAASTAPNQAGLQYVLLTFFAVAAGYLVVTKDYRGEQWAEFRSWTVMTTRDPSLLQMVAQLQRQPEDEIIVFCSERRPGSFFVDPKLNFLARKSGIQGDPYWMIDSPSLFRRQLELNALADSLVDGIEKGHVEAATLDGLDAMRAGVVLPLTRSALLPGWTVAMQSGDWVLMRPPHATKVRLE